MPYPLKQSKYQQASCSTGMELTVGSAGRKYIILFLKFESIYSVGAHVIVKDHLQMGSKRWRCSVRSASQSKLFDALPKDGCSTAETGNAFLWRKKSKLSTSLRCVQLIYSRCCKCIFCLTRFPASGLPCVCTRVLCPVCKLALVKLNVLRPRKWRVSWDPHCWHAHPASCSIAEAMKVQLLLTRLWIVHTRHVWLGNRPQYKGCYLLYTLAEIPFFKIG
jgi:hypothetical protein